MSDFDDPLRDFMQRYMPQQRADPQELHRLRVLLEGAEKQRQKVYADIEQSRIDSAKGRVDFFDRLTIGSGATIAALVSFLGAHTSKLQPTWILRGALVSLVLTMIAGLFRNYRYPNYVLQIHKISLLNSSRYQQQCRLNCLKADPTAISIQTGQQIDLPKTIKDFEKSDEELETHVVDARKLGRRLEKQWTYAQFVCISFATLAAVLLVWLAIANF
jgi:hypothetical protein